MSFDFPLTARPATFTDEGDPDVQPSTSSSASDYDFLQGQHSIRHKKLKERLNGCTEWIDIDGSKNTEKILGGVGNFEKHFERTRWTGSGSNRLAVVRPFHKALEFVLG